MIQKVIRGRYFRLKACAMRNERGNVKKATELCKRTQQRKLLTVLKMKQIVPEFVSNNSKYQVLDK